MILLQLGYNQSYFELKNEHVSIMIPNVKALSFFQK